MNIFMTVIFLSGAVLYSIDYNNGEDGEEKLKVLSSLFILSISLWSFFLFFKYDDMKDLNSLTKYPRTYHLPFSKGLQNNDRRISDLSAFEGSEIVVTEKMDGENTTIYKDYIHPRSLIGDNHPSRDWVKAHAATFQYRLTKSHRICGENMYAKHSIFYDNLLSYFYVFNIWGEDTCFSFDDTIKLCTAINLIHVPVLYKGIFDYDLIEAIYNNLDFDKSEGIVVRVANSFNIEDFATHVAKAVRPNHVQTDVHWTKKWTKNLLIKNN